MTLKPTTPGSGSGAGSRPLVWPDDPEGVTAADIDFEALAHVLANTCRRGGCCRQYHSVAAHAVVVSEEIEALDGLGDEDRRTLALHGIRIHMSGCPSSCAQHFTADIGLKGVRVRRLIGTREGFDVYLGGGVAGDVHLGGAYATEHVRATAVQPPDGRLEIGGFPQLGGERFDRRNGQNGPDDPREDKRTATSLELAGRHPQKSTHGSLPAKNRLRVTVN